MSNNEKLQGTPDWSTAPEWANYWAVDADGEAYWYERRPWVLFKMWTEIIASGNIEYIGVVDATNWKSSLQKRP